MSRQPLHVGPYGEGPSSWPADSCSSRTWCPDGSSSTAWIARASASLENLSWLPPIARASPYSTANDGNSTDQVCSKSDDVCSVPDDAGSEVVSCPSQERRGRGRSRSRSSSSSDDDDEEDSDYPPLDPVIRELSPIQEYDELFRTSGKWALALSSVVVISDDTYVNPNCECGGGSYLGSIRTIAMYENHRSIDCVISSKKLFIPYLVPTYFNILKIFESITKDPKLSYENKIINLIHTWESSHKKLYSELYAGTHVFVHYAVSESAVVILDPGWDMMKKNLKSRFRLVLKKILRTLLAMKCHPEAVKSCHFLLAIIDYPWNHHYLPKLFHQIPSEEEVFNFIEYEKSNIFALRLKLLCEGRCEEQALQMSSLAVNLYKNNERSKSHFRKEDIEFIRDIYFGCLAQSNKVEELVDELQEFVNKSNSKILLKRLSSKIDNLSEVRLGDRPKICKNLLVVYEMIANIVVTNHFTNDNLYDQFSDILMLWCTFMLKYMKSCDIDNSSFKKLVLKFTMIPSKAKNLYKFCDILHENFGSTLPLSLYLEIYINALQTNINEKEYNKLMMEKKYSMTSLTELTQGYLKLANLLEDVVSVCRECVLTAYALMPSKDLMNQIQNLAIKSGKLSPEHLNDKSENSCDKSMTESATNIPPVDSNKQKKDTTKTCESDQNSKTEIIYGVNDSYTIICHDLNSLPDPLTPVMQDNLVSVLNYPRYGSFNWNLEWSEMKIKCQQYLENLDTIIGRNVLRPEDLKYINMDVNTYNECSKAYRKNLTNDKGYFSSDINSDLESSASAASSGEIVTYRILNTKKCSRKSKRCSQKRKVVTRKKKSIDALRKKPQVNFQKRRNLRSQKSFEVTEDSNSLLNDETKDKKLNIEVEDNNSVDSASKDNVRKNKERKYTEKVIRAKRITHKNQHKDYDYSWYPKKGNLTKSDNLIISKDKNSRSISMTELNDKLPTTSEHLSMLSERIPQLSSLEFMMPTNTDRIVNVVQIQTTSNTLNNVSQPQTEHASNHHSNNEIEKKTNDNQTNTHPLENFVSLYQSNSLNNSMNSGTHQGECSFTGSVSVSNQKIPSDPIKNVHNIGPQGTNKKPIDSTDVFLDQNPIVNRHWNDIQLQHSAERQPTVENAVHLSSNVIVRTSDIINPSNVSQTTGNATTTTKKSTNYCVKARDRFIDYSFPASISSTSTNCNRSPNISALMHSNKSHFETKSSPVQTSIGLQVNFNDPESDAMQSMISPNNQSQMSTNVTESQILANVPAINDRIITSRINTSSIGNPSFIKENNSFDNLKPNVSVINPVSTIHTPTCVGLRPSKEVSDPSASVLSLMIASTQSQVIKTNVHNSLYTSTQNKRMQLTDLSHTSQTNRSDEQKKIDNLKLISQTFTATSEAIKFVTSSTESQHLIQCTEKNNASNLAIFQNVVTEGVSGISQENNSNAKSLNRARGNMRTYESKTRALKQANMSDMFVFEKGTLYAVQDDVVNQIEPSKSVISPRNTAMANIKIQNRQIKELSDRPKLSPNASPNVTITGSMLPRFQQVFGKTKFQSSNIINDTSSLCSSSVTSIPSSISGQIVNRTITSTPRVYSTSKGVQTNPDLDDPVSSNTINSLPSKGLENRIQHNISMTKASNVTTGVNIKNNVIMTCKTVPSVKNVPQVSASSSHLLTSNIDVIHTVKKEVISMPVSKVPSFTTSCNNSSIASSSSNLIYSIPLQSDTKASSIEKPLQGIKQIQQQLKVSPSVVQTVLRKHPTWQQNCFRQGKQNTEVQATERMISASITNTVKTTIESSNHKPSISTCKSNVTEPNVSSSMMEQVREFESVLEEVRKTSLMNEMSTANMLPQINHEIIQMHSPTENVDLLNSDNSQTLFPLNKKSNINNERERCSFSFLNQTLSNVNELTSEEKEPVSIAPSVISVRSDTPTQSVTSPNNNLSVSPVDGSSQCPKQQIANKPKPVIKTPSSSPSTSAVKVPVLQKPLPKLQEDEQTTQRIYAILDKYAEQLRNSPELKNKPAPRRRTNPPTNPSLNSKRKKSTQLNLKTCSQQTSCSSSGMEMSPTSDMHAIDSEDSSNAVSHFSHIINSPSRNTDEQTTATTVGTDTPLTENALINVNDVIKQINVDAEMKSKVSQSTQIMVSGTSGSFLSIPEGSTGNVRLLVAAGNNQKMYRLHCPVTGPGPVLFHEISAKDSCSKEVKMSSSILGQNINESAILSAITANDIQVANTGLGNEILLNASQNSAVFEHKMKKPDIVLESMEKAQVLDNNEKPFPIMKKNQASQSTFSVIHPLPTPELIDDKELILSDNQKNISENIKKNVIDNEQNNSYVKQELINNSKIDQVVIKQEKLSITLKKEPPYVLPSESSSVPFGNIEFTPFCSQKIEREIKQEISNRNENNSLQTITNSDIKQFDITNTNQISVDCTNDKKLSIDTNNLNVLKCEKNTVVKHENSSNIIPENSSNILKIPNPKKKEQEENKPNVALSDMTAAASTAASVAASAAEIISTASQTSNTYKQKEDLSKKTVKTECELENENTLSNTVYNMLDNQSATGMNTKIGSLTLRLKNDRSAKNWNKCLSKLMPPGTEKMLESENLKQLQESFQHTQIKTFKDLKMFLFEQCKKFDNNVETPKEYDLYDDIDGLGVDKPSTNELFPEVAILNDLDKSVSPTLGLLQASTSKSNDTNALQAKRKSVLSHTTTSTVISTSMDQSNNSKKNKNKVSFLKQALYNEMNLDSNDCETKSFINGSTKSVLDSIEQNDSGPESPLNIAAVDSETCMSEDSTSTISSGTPHYNFRKSKRKNIEEDGFIESQVIKRMYRGRTSEDNDDKTEPSKINNTKAQMSDQKSTAEKKESNLRRLSSRLKNNNVKNNQHLSNKSMQVDSPPYKITTMTRSSLRRVSRKTT